MLRSPSGSRRRRYAGRLATIRDTHRESGDGPSAPKSAPSARMHPSARAHTVMCAVPASYRRRIGSVARTAPNRKKIKTLHTHTSFPPSLPPSLCSRCGKSSTFWGGQLKDDRPFNLSTPGNFTASDLDTDQWAEAVHAFGGKYQVLNVKDESGFLLWPTKCKDKRGTVYPYTVANGRFPDRCVAIALICYYYGVSFKRRAEGKKRGKPRNSKRRRAEGGWDRGSGVGAGGWDWE